MYRKNLELLLKIICKQLDSNKEVNSSQCVCQEQMSNQSSFLSRQTAWTAKKE